jgi:hypothetical protein
MIKKNGISFKTIQKNKKLGEFVEEKEKDLVENEE